MSGPCSERAWCIVTDAEEHRDYHAGAIVELTGSDGSGEAGWWAWPVQDHGRRVVIEIEGHAFPMAASVTPSDIAVILAATETPEARQALIDLAVAVDGEASS